MTVRKVWLGSTGPFLYDDSVLYIDEDGVISPDNQQAIATDGQIVIQSPPSSPVHAVRKQDLDDAVGDIASLETRIASLETQVGNLNTTVYVDHQNAIVSLLNKFPAPVGFTMAYDGFVDNSGLPASYRMIDKLVALSVPGKNGVSNWDHILLGNIPSAIYTPQYAITHPVLVNTAANGWDWCALTSNSGSSWAFTIKPFVKAAGFPATGTKYLPSFTLIYAIA